MSRKFTFLLFSFISFFTSAQKTLPIIPKPEKVTIGEGFYELNAKTKIVIPAGDAEATAIAENMRLRFLITSGKNLEITNSENSNAIVFKKDESLAKEAYNLKITKGNVEIKAASDQGFFYAYQTLLQLFDSKIYSSSAENSLKLDLPICEISDSPRFAYRGLMLDVGRHYLPVSFIKKYLDLMAMYKFNTFQWHLTEDQGWRIEIKKYPKLTEIGSTRKETPLGHNSENRGDGKPHSGFYTQDEVKEIVAYAASKYINVIPEIEMPGHALAALASYPELGCTGGPYEVKTRWGVEKQVFCPSEKTFTFLEDVLTEVMDLFPSEYLHIGGDECPKDTWKASAFCQDLMKKEGLKDEHELQSYFIKRIDQFVTSKGRRIIGWDEILEGGLSPNATVMSWRGVQGGIEAAKLNHDVIMTPNTYYYIDYYQGDPANEPLAIGGYLPLEKVYSYEPLAEDITEDQKKHILGVQGNLWTEYVATPEKAEYMTFPRALAIAETGWSAPGKNEADFMDRVKRHFSKLKLLGVNYSESIYNIKLEVKPGGTGQLKALLTNEDQGSKIRYTLDGTQVNAQSLIYKSEGITLSSNTQLNAALFNEKNEQYGKPLSDFLMVNKATGLEYKLKSSKSRYTGGSKFALTDGKTGNADNLNTWVGVNGEDLELVLDLGKSTKLTSAGIGFLNAPDSWIMFPKMVSISLSEDGKTFVSPGGAVMKSDNAKKVERININLNGQNARYLKITAENYGMLPEDHPGKGNKAWLFVDEIEVK